MEFQVYNTLTRRKEPFRSIEEGVVRMYNCGPTVYSRVHVGNFRSFLFADVLRRWLEYLGYEVRQVMNITDVGHLTDDVAGEGEDRLEAQARREGIDPWKVAEEYTRPFFADMEKLSFRPALLNPRASDHVPEMLEMIDGLVEKGHAYRAGESVYFDVGTFERYGRLSGNKVEDLEAGARVAVLEEKRHPADFALWKSDPHHLMKWASHYGEHGFPGWHIECSAMARKHLGDRIDIHTGGEDNIFPHHECEIAQSECFTGEPFANYWMHAKFLLIDAGKMAKSLGNTYTVDDVEERGYEPRVLRYALIRGHYRQPLNFTWEILEESRAALENLDDLVRRLRRAAAAGGGERGADEVATARRDFEAGMNDDLNVPRALSALNGLRAATLADELGPASAGEGLAFVERANQVLAVIRFEEESLHGDVQARIDAREQARAEKDWAESDRIRDELAAEGIVLEDTPDGVLWHRK